MNQMIAGRVSCCAWWATLSGTHVAVVGTKDGTICFFSLPDGEFLIELNVQERIEKLEVVEDEKDQSKCLFVQAGMLYRLQLECEEETEDGPIVATVLDSLKLQQRQAVFGVSFSFPSRFRSTCWESRKGGVGVVRPLLCCAS